MYLLLFTELKLVIIYLILKDIDGRVALIAQLVSQRRSQLSFCCTVEGRRGELSEYPPTFAKKVMKKGMISFAVGFFVLWLFFFFGLLQMVRKWTR